MALFAFAPGPLWLDGSLAPLDATRAQVLAMYPLAFETLFAFAQPDGSPGLWCLGTHLARLRQATLRAGDRLPWSADALAQGCVDLLAARGLAPTELRLLVLQWERGVHVAITARAPAGAVEGLHLGSRAWAEGPATTPLVMDPEGAALGPPGLGLLAVEGACLLAPASAHRGPDLPTRLLMELGQQAGLSVREVPMGGARLLEVDELFACSPAHGPLPVLELDGLPIGEGAPGPWTRRLQRTWAAAVGGRLPWLHDRITRRAPATTVGVAR